MSARYIILWRTMVTQGRQSVERCDYLSSSEDTILRLVSWEEVWPIGMLLCSPRLPTTRGFFSVSAGTMISESMHVVLGQWLQGSQVSQMSRGSSVTLKWSVDCVKQCLVVPLLTTILRRRCWQDDSALAETEFDPCSLKIQYWLKLLGSDSACRPCANRCPRGVLR